MDRECWLWLAACLWGAGSLAVYLGAKDGADWSERRGKRRWLKGGIKKLAKCGLLSLLEWKTRHKRLFLWKYSLQLMHKHESVDASSHQQLLPSCLSMHLNANVMAQREAGVPWSPVISILWQLACHLLLQATRESSFPKLFCISNKIQHFIMATLPAWQIRESNPTC